MGIIKWDKECTCCKVPLNVCMILSFSEYNMIHTYSSLNPIDLSMNKLIYKIIDNKAIPYCKYCYTVIKEPKFRFVTQRRFGHTPNKPRVPIKKSKDLHRDIIPWVDEYKLFERENFMFFDFGFLSFPIVFNGMPGIKVEIE